MNSLTQHIKIVSIISFLVTSLSLSLNIHAETSDKSLTYFQYQPSALLPLKKLSSSDEMTVNQLKKWDTIMFNLVKQNKLSGIPASNIYTYVYIAQRDAAFISKNLKHQFMGSLDPISSKVLCLFFPNHCKELEKKSSTDFYSNKLADIVLDKIKLRIAQDKKQSKIYSQKLKGENYWIGKHPYVGQDTGSKLPWLISSPNEFLPPPPPAPNSTEWQHQLKETKQALKNITPEQKRSIHYWAGNPSTITPAGMWLNFANEYMDTLQTPLAKRLLVRSVLAMGIVDSFITIFHAKYTYWVKRPFMLDPSLRTVLKTPNHPSYPAGHAALSATAATILNYYFPEKKQQWWRMVDESSKGRIIGGIHFPIDIEEGAVLGKKVGKAAVSSQFKQVNMLGLAR